MHNQWMHSSLLSSCVLLDFDIAPALLLDMPVAAAPQRMAVIDADAPLATVQARLSACLEARVSAWL